MCSFKLAKTILVLVISLLSLGALTVNAQTKVAVLDFELKDLTLKPGIPAEIERTASVKPMLEDELAKSGFKIVNIPLIAQLQASAGEGYLFDHHDIVAQLAKQFGADYVVVGKLHKPSFLFIYLMAHLVEASTGHLVANLLTEVKGSEKKLTQKGVESLALKIATSLNN